MHNIVTKLQEPGSWAAQDLHMDVKSSKEFRNGFFSPFLFLASVLSYKLAYNNLFSS